MTLLYHYCSVVTFHSIISNRNIRLSSLSLSNDTMEGKLVSYVFDQLMERDNIDQKERALIKDAINFAENLCDGLGFCLSETGDLLSQWRGYTDDGTGFSIGFSKEYFENLSKNNDPKKASFSIEKVLYDKIEHEIALKPIYDEIRLMLDSGKLNPPTLGLIALADPTGQISKKKWDDYRDNLRTLWKKASQILAMLYALKSEAFAEEKEWRLLSYLMIAPEDYSEFRPANNRIIPFRSFELKKMQIEPIKEIILGPKNITPDFVIEKFLLKHEFAGVEIKHSVASYR